MNVREGVRERERDKIDIKNFKLLIYKTLCVLQECTNVLWYLKISLYSITSLETRL